MRLHPSKALRLFWGLLRVRAPPWVGFRCQVAVEAIGLMVVSMVLWIQKRIRKERIMSVFPFRKLSAGQAVVARRALGPGGQSAGEACKGVPMNVQMDVPASGKRSPFHDLLNPPALSPTTPAYGPPRRKPLFAFMANRPSAFHEAVVHVSGVTHHDSGSFVVDFRHRGADGSVLGATPDEAPPVGGWVWLRWLQRAPTKVWLMDRWRAVDSTTRAVPWIAVHALDDQPDTPALASRRLRLMQWVDQLSPAWASLVHAVFADRQDLLRFLRAPASIQHHHAHEGGLLEHSLEVAQAAMALVAPHAWVHRDLVLAGALLHDVGKIDEYERLGSRCFASDTGHLVGHRAQGAIRVQRAAAHEGFAAASLRHLLHVLLAVADQQSVGGMPNSKMLEATVVNLADRFSAAKSVSEILCPQPGWSFHQGASSIAWSAKRNLGFRGIQLRPPVGSAP